MDSQPEVEMFDQVSDIMRRELPVTNQTLKAFPTKSASGQGTS